MPNLKNPNAELLKKMRIAGHSFASIGNLFGISRQRVAQITGKVTYNRSCKNCSTGFETSFPKSIFCNPDCGDAFRRERKTIAKTGKPNPTSKYRRANISQSKRFKILERDSFTCQYCGRKAPEVVLHCDHIKPASKGGTNDISNLATACFDCNAGKSNTSLKVKPAELLK